MHLLQNNNFVSNTQGKQGSEMDDHQYDYSIPSEALLSSQNNVNQYNY
jgi:hypothetical protein